MRRLLIFGLVLIAACQSSESTVVSPDENTAALGQVAGSEPANGTEGFALPESQLPAPTTQDASSELADTGDSFPRVTLPALEADIHTDSDSQTSTSILTTTSVVSLPSSSTSSVTTSTTTSTAVQPTLSSTTAVSTSTTSLQPSTTSSSSTTTTTIPATTTTSLSVKAEKPDLPSGPDGTDNAINNLDDQNAAPRSAADQPNLAEELMIETDPDPKASRYDSYQHTYRYGADLNADLFAPSPTALQKVGDYPVVVLVHGGSWLGGERSAMYRLADRLADAGLLALSIGYRDVREGGVFPKMMDDVACGVRLGHEIRTNYSASDRLYLMGHSAGAHLSVLIGYSGDRFGDSCPLAGEQWVTGVVGLAGPYDINLVPVLPNLFVGGTRINKSEEWNASNPHSYIGTEPLPSTLLLHGESDLIAPILFSERLANDLTEAGQQVDFQRLSIDHNEIIDPNLVGDELLEWLGLAPLL